MSTQDRLEEGKGRKNDVIVLLSQKLKQMIKKTCETFFIFLIKHTKSVSAQNLFYL